MIDFQSVYSYGAPYQSMSVHGSYSENDKYSIYQYSFFVAMQPTAGLVEWTVCLECMLAFAGSSPYGGFFVLFFVNNFFTLFSKYEFR